VLVKSFYEGEDYLYRLVKMLSGGIRRFGSRVIASAIPIWLSSLEKHA